MVALLLIQGLLTYHQENERLSDYLEIIRKIGHFLQKLRILYQGNHEPIKALKRAFAV